MQTNFDHPCSGISSVKRVKKLADRLAMKKKSKKVIVLQLAGKRGGVKPHKADPKPKSNQGKAVNQEEGECCSERIENQEGQGR